MNDIIYIGSVNREQSDVGGRANFTIWKIYFYNLIKAFLFALAKCTIHLAHFHTEFPSKTALEPQSVHV